MVVGAGQRKLNAWIALLVVGAAGAVESLYGRTQYLGDWLCYLNVSRAVTAHDWRSIFDPMWSPGYPILVGLVRLIFPATAAGEWYAICLLNWILFLAFYAAWQYLIREVIAQLSPTLASEEDRPAILWTTTAIFLTFGLCFDQASRVSPDLMVSALFILASAQTLRLMRRPTAKAALVLGLILGAGCWTKGIFLAYSGIFLCTLALGCLRRGIQWRVPAVAFASFLLVFAPYAAATSWAYGRFTLGVTGEMNYAFHVNHLPHWTNWQGGPAELGTPIHPTKPLIENLPAFGFAAPFRTTYPPYNNMAYYYQGYRHFFRLHNQIAAFVRCFRILLQIARVHLIFFALILALAAVLLKRDWRDSLRKTIAPVWFLFFPPLLGLAAYMLVHIEDRYLSPFLLIASLIPLLPLLNPDLKSKRLLAISLLAVFTLASLAEQRSANGHTLNVALHRQDFRQGELWKISTAMTALGLKAGDPVAMIVDTRFSPRCSWAYFSQLRIVAEFGGLPLAVQPTETVTFVPRTSGEETTNYVLMFRSLSPEKRGEVMDAFRQQGALAVLAYQEPEEKAELGGWKPIAGTTSWVYLFPR
jgi:hypothetical protein